MGENPEYLKRKCIIKYIKCRRKASRRCSSYIFIFDLTPGFNGLGKHNSHTTRVTFRFWDLGGALYQRFDGRFQVHRKADLWQLRVSFVALDKQRKERVDGQMALYNSDSRHCWILTCFTTVPTKSMLCREKWIHPLELNVCILETIKVWWRTPDSLFNTSNTCLRYRALAFKH